MKNSVNVVEVGDLLRKTLSYLANLAMENHGYTHPFTIVIVSGDGSVKAVRMEAPGQLISRLFEYFSNPDALRYPLDFFLSCKDSNPISARMIDSDGEPTWIH